MLYLAYQTHADIMGPVRAMAQAGLSALGPLAAAQELKFLRNVTAAYELIARAGLTHSRPAYGIETVKVGNRDVAVTQEAVMTTAFATLLRFKKDSEAVQPRVLVVAPLSGHFATLLRSLVKTMLPEHDVCITDWHNAREASTEEGRFGFDDYVDHLMAFLEKMGPGVHVVAVCQPCVQVLAAAAVMAQAGSPAQPRSMTLMAGPIDTRVHPTKVNQLATSKPMRWFEDNLIATVPMRYKGAGRRVYPGFVQLSAFMAMNLERHRKAHIDLYEHLANGNVEKAKPTMVFYDEYFAVLDLAAEFYLETVSWVFQEARLATGSLTHRGRRVEPKAIRRTALLTVEGERDDICSLGQTAAAHELCKGLKPYMKRHHMQVGVGHYGVFSGKRWEEQVYPIVRNLVLANE
jgi:poly(3-hydroxybutyrate) depolymerase